MQKAQTVKGDRYRVKQGGGTHALIALRGDRHTGLQTDLLKSTQVFVSHVIGELSLNSV